MERPTFRGGSSVILCMNIPVKNASSSPSVFDKIGSSVSRLWVRVQAPGGMFKRVVLFWFLQNINGNKSLFRIEWVER